MLRLGIIGALFALPSLVTAGPLRADSEGRSLAASTPWHVNYADDSCRLERRFGEGEDAILLVMDRYEPGHPFRLTLAGQPLRRARVPRYIRLRFGDGEDEHRLTFSSGSLGEQPAIFVNEPLRVSPLTEEEQAEWDRIERGGTPVHIDAQPLDPSRIAAVEYLEFDTAGISPVRLETGSLGPPFEAFEQCVRELLTHWGLDAETQLSRTRPAMPAENPGRWLVSSDYPREALRRGDQGVVNFRLIVDRAGNVAECHIQQSSRPASFDEAVCRGITRRARFEPALDAEGNPIESYYVNTVRFRI